MTIFLDHNAEPNEMARTLWRELGPRACIELALSLAVRGDEQQTIILDSSGLEERDGKLD
jgi:hypothetical protein